MLHFSDGQKLDRDIKLQTLSDHLESILTCFPMVLTTPLCVSMLASESCLQHCNQQALWSRSWWHTRFRAQQLWYSSCSTVLYLEAGTWFLNVFTSKLTYSGIFYIIFNFYSQTLSSISCLLFKHCLTHQFQWQFHSCSSGCIQTQGGSTSFTHLISHSAYFFFSPFTAHVTILSRSRHPFRQTSFFSETKATQQVLSSIQVKQQWQGFPLSHLFLQHGFLWEPCSQVFVICDSILRMEQRCNTSRLKCELGAKCRQAHWGRGEVNRKFRHNWTSSKPLQSQLAAPSSRGLSEIRDKSESEVSI